MVNVQTIVYNAKYMLAIRAIIYTATLSSETPCKRKHKIKTFGDFKGNFSILKKRQGKLNCLIFEMLWIREKKPILNMHSDSALRNYLSKSRRIY